MISLHEVAKGLKDGFSRFNPNIEVTGISLGEVKEDKSIGNGSITVEVPVKIRIGKVRNPKELNFFYPEEGILPQINEVLEDRIRGNIMFENLKEGVFTFTLYGNPIIHIVAVNQGENEDDPERGEFMVIDLYIDR